MHFPNMDGNKMFGQEYTIVAQNNLRSSKGTRFEFNQYPNAMNLATLMRSLILT